LKRKPGSDYAGLYPTQSPHDGAGIPTLLQVIEAHPGLRFNIELKVIPPHPEWTVGAEEMADRVLHVVDAAGAGPRVTIQSFDWRAPRHVRRTRPDIARGWLTAADTIRDAPLWRGDGSASTQLDGVPDAVAAEGGGTWAAHHAELTQDLLARAHALGLLVIPWTVNEAPDMRRLIGWGVDGLITDWPDRAIPLLPG
jgi:glycerophosphoryl diester phosphodiesterase